jgi:hypothetical protein
MAANLRPGTLSLVAPKTRIPVRRNRAALAAFLQSRETGVPDLAKVAARRPPVAPGPMITMGSIVAI